MASHDGKHYDNPYPIPKFLATNLSDQALTMNAAKPVAVTLTGLDEQTEALTFVHGESQQEIGHLGGRLGRNMAYTRFYDWPPANQSAS